MTFSTLPSHISIIMDGNGRWARQRGQARIEGHYAGVESVRDCCEYAAEIGLKYLSLFAFSTENWDRPQEEVSHLMELMAHCIINERPTFQKNNIRLLVIGDRSQLSANLIHHIDEVTKETSSNTGLTLVIFLSYSGRWDILQAAELYSKDTTKSFESCLSTAGIPDPELLIRTSGEQRISNYMLWQCAYTEFYFTDVLWPDFRRKQFELAICDFNSRQRRFGKTEEQLNDK